MADYVRVYKTSDESEVNKYIQNGWDLIDTTKSVDYDTGGRYVKHVLGLSYKEQANKLLTIIREYEKYGFKEELIKKVEDEMDDRLEDYKAIGFPDIETPLANYMTNYENVVNNKDVFYSKKWKKYKKLNLGIENSDDIPF